MPAITRLGAWGHNTRRTGSFARGAVPEPPPPPPPAEDLGIPGGGLGRAFFVRPRRGWRTHIGRGDLDLTLYLSLVGAGVVEARAPAELPRQGRGEANLYLALSVEAGASAVIHHIAGAGYAELPLRLLAEGAGAVQGPAVLHIALHVEGSGVIKTSPFPLEVLGMLMLLSEEDENDDEI